MTEYEKHKIALEIKHLCVWLPIHEQELKYNQEYLAKDSSYSWAAAKIVALKYTIQCSKEEIERLQSKLSQDISNT